MNYSINQTITILLIISSIVFSCQSPQASDQINEKEKLEYQKKKHSG